MTFYSARIRLTLWYTLIMIIITLLFSLIIYGIQMEEVLRSVQHTRVIISREYGMFPRPERVVFIDTQALEESRKNILQKLAYTNLGVLLITAGAAYFLAGRTLRPIESASELQKNFISDASHEIRTPLTAMRTSLEVSLRDPVVDPSAKAILEENLLQVTHLQNLSDSLLNLSQLESASQILRTPLSLLSIFDKVLGIIEPVAQSKEITVKLPETDSMVKGNSSKLSELFVILLENAVKYSPEKSSIRVTWLSQRSHTLISIIDNGIGISSEDLPHIFDRFYRSDKSRSAGTGGYGLGLSIAKRIVELHNGSITVTSVPLEGTTFKIMLPSA